MASETQYTLCHCGENALPEADSSATLVAIRFYGGWLQDGALTPLASDIELAFSSAPFFPMRHPFSGLLLRGTIGLATRLVDVPSVQWPNTRKLLQRFN